MSVSQTMEFTYKEGNGVEEEDVELKSSKQARSEGGLGTVIEALNFEGWFLPRIRVEHFGSMRK